MRLALFVALLLFAPFAHAGAAIAAVAEWVITHYIISQVILTVALTVYGSATQRRQARHAQQDARNQALAALQDRNATIITAEAPHVYIYGRARVGSAIVAVFTSGAFDEFKWLVCVHAAHECDGREGVYILGKDIGALDGSGYVTGGPYAIVSTQQAGAFNAPESHNGPSFNLAHTPLPGTLTIWREEFTGSAPYNVTHTHHTPPYTLVGTLVTLTGAYAADANLFYVSYQYTQVDPRVRVITHLGAAGQTADAALMAAKPGIWTSTATLDTLCYSVVMLDLRQPEFQGGVVPIEVLLRGKKTFDPRSGLTIWNQNNALGIRDYLISEMCGVPAADVPSADVITAANVCDEAQSFGNRYTMNGTVSADEDQKQVLEQMAQSMAGSIVSTTWSITAGKYIAPVVVLDQSDIVGSLSINPGISDADLFNGVKGQAITPENFYVSTDFDPYQNSTYVTADGGEQWNTINFPWTNSKQRVWNLCRIFTEDQRNGFSLKAEFSLKTWARKVGERISFNSTFLGQVAKVYRLTDKKYTPGGVVELSIKEDAASIWDFADAVTADSTPNTTLPSPFVVNKLTGIVVASGTASLLKQSDGTIISRIHVTWNIASSQSVINNGLIEVEWFKLEDQVPHKQTVSGSDTGVYVSPVEDGKDYQIRVRAVNPYVNAKSDWTYAPAHTVIGKTEPPASIQTMTIDGFTLSWAEVSDLDLAGYIFRFQYGNNTNWESATALHKGIITSSPYDIQVLPFGPVTIMGKAVDTSGNESLITVNIFSDLGDPIVRNVVTTIPFDPTYPGTFSGCSVVGGDVVATGLDSFYGSDSVSFYDINAVPFYEASSYGQMQYTTAEFSITTALEGSLVTLLMATQGDGLVVEYRYVGSGSFYGTDSDPWYEADGLPFYQTDVGPWLPWPGSIVATRDVFQIRVTIAGGTVQGKITTMSLVVDAPDINEFLSNIAISALGTAIPYTKGFTNIQNIQATLQANTSGAITVEIDKASPMVPIARAFNSAHTAVAGASVDFHLQGY